MDMTLPTFHIACEIINQFIVYKIIIKDKLSLSTSSYSIVLIIGLVFI